MHPIVTTLEAFGTARPIGGYGLMLTVAALVFAGLAVRAGARAGLDPGALVASLAVCLATAAAGGYLLSALVQTLRTGDVVGALGAPALTFYGGLAGGVLGLWFATRAHGLSPAQVLAHSVGPLALAHGLGRIGCLLGGCCYGAPYQGLLAVRYTHPLAPVSDGLPRHAVQLYEAAGLLALGAWLLLRPLGPSPATRAVTRRIATYACAYAVLRFTVELFRGDPERGLWFGEALSTSQLLSALLLLAGLWGLLSVSRRWAASFHLKQAPVDSSP